MAGMSQPRFVGRHGERAAVLQALARLTDGRTQWVSVVGEPGIGKTRLLAELSSEAVDRGYLVLTGRGLEFEREVPLGVWVDALDDYLGAVGAGGIAAEQVALLATVFPSLAAPDEKLIEPSLLPTERFRLHRALRTLVGSLAVDRPVVVVLDDLQWADPASAELLAYLVRRPPTGPVLLAVASRVGQAPAGLGDALEVAAQEGNGVSVWLSPLTRGEARELLAVAGTPAGAELNRCFELSGGNPFYLEQLARARPPVEPWTGGTERDVPPVVRAALAHEIATLPSVARVLAEGAAVAGEPFMLELAARAADLPVAVVEEAIDELLVADLVRRTEVPRRYRFRHPIVRHAVYIGTAERWVRAAHRRVADALAAAGAPLSVQAHHVRRCARLGDESAALLLRDAARMVTGQSPAAAGDWLQSALDILPAASVGHRLELTAELARILLSIGRLEDGRQRLLDLLDMLPDQAQTSRVQVVAACAATEHLLGRHDAADKRLHRALAELPAEPTAEAAALHIEAAAAAAHRAEFEPAIHWAQLARSEADAAGAPSLAALAAAIVVFGRVCSATAAETADDLDAIIRQVDGLTEDQLAGRAEVFLYLANAAHWSEHYVLAERHFRRGIRLSRATGQGQFLTPMQIGLCHTLAALGRIAEAVEHGEAAVDAARLGGVPQLVAWALTNLAWAHAAAGDLANALAVGTEALGFLDGVEDGLITASVHGHLGVIYAQAGEIDRCHVEFAAAGAPEFRLFSVDRRCRWYAQLAESELSRGRSEAAGRWVSRGEQAGAVDLPVASGAVARAKARLMLHSGDAAGAAEVAQRAGHAASARNARVEAACSWLLAGEALAALGNSVAAHAALTAARDEFSECGAVRYEADANAALHSLGPLPVGSDKLSPLSQLSPRERQIADLVAAGRTNRQIAAALYLSAKTVESYLTQVYAKLGVRSRAGLAEIVGRARAGTG